MQLKLALSCYIIISLIVTGCVAQDQYEVADIDCAVGSGKKEIFTARLRKPEGFRGDPIFADDRGSAFGRENAENSVSSRDQDKEPCRIFRDPTDSSGRVFVLRITDFLQCGVLKRNGFIHVRVWFPQLPGVVMLSDQEVIIMCKPPQPIVTQSKTAGFAGSIPSGARVSGVVEEIPGRLEYEVALFRENSLPQGRSSDGGNGIGAFLTGSGAQELPVDHAVPIGTRLQLRARISDDSSWQHAKLMEVSVSPDPKDGNAVGSVSLVKSGCRNPDLSSIIPKQPYRLKERSNEVVLDFEAFLLSNMGERNTLWLHTQIKACMEEDDCYPEHCEDKHQPTSFGRRKRNAQEPLPLNYYNSTDGKFVANYAAPLNLHWRTASSEPVSDVPLTIDPPVGHNGVPSPSPSGVDHTSTTSMPDLETARPKGPVTPFNAVPSSPGPQINASSTKFANNIGFSVLMPAEYYQKTPKLSLPTECRLWMLSSLVSSVCALIFASCFFMVRKNLKSKSGDYMSYPPGGQNRYRESSGGTGGRSSASPPRYPTCQVQYARDSSLYRS